MVRHLYIYNLICACLLSGTLYAGTLTSVMASDAWEALALPQRQAQLMEDEYVELTAQLVQQVQVPYLLKSRIELSLRQLLEVAPHMSYSSKIDTLRSGRREWIGKTEERANIQEIWEQQVEHAFPYPTEIRTEIRSLIRGKVKEQEGLQELTNAILPRVKRDPRLRLSEVQEQPHVKTESYPLMIIDYRGALDQWIAYTMAATWADTSLPSFWTGFRLLPDSHLVGPSLPKQTRAIELVSRKMPDPLWLQSDQAIAQTKLQVAAWLVDDTSSPAEFRRKLHDALVGARIRTKGPGVIAIIKDPREVIAPAVNMADVQMNYENMKPLWLRGRGLPDFPFITTQLSKLESGRTFAATMSQAQGTSYEEVANTPHFFLLQRLFPHSLKTAEDWDLLVNEPNEFVAQHLTKVILSDVQNDINKKPRRKTWAYQVHLYVYY
jgi:hypothetical protein